jgi:hypothetical protein
MNKIPFSLDHGDRVAKKPDGSGRAAKTFTEAISYATHRARKTQFRQQLRRNQHGWWLSICIKEGR